MTADSPLKLDERTEQLISEAIYHETTLQDTLGRNSRTAASWIRAREAIRDQTLNALRSRIRELEETRVRDFATYLADTTQRTVQREKLQSFATEFLNDR